MGASGRSNYYHWMFDMLPRIEALRAAAGAQPIDRWILPETRLGAAVEMLAACGVDPARVHWQSRGAQVECERLLVSHGPAPLGGPTARSVAFLRAAMRPSAAPPGGRRLLLLRRSTRRIANADEVARVASARGVEAVATEGMSLRAQAELFAGASLLVGIHGAGLANAVFMAPGTPLVEVVPEWYVVPCYLRLAVEAGLPYRALAGRPVPGAPARGPHDDVLVDPAELARAIDAADAARAPARPA